MKFKRKQKSSARRTSNQEGQPVFSYYTHTRSDNSQNVGRGEEGLPDNVHLWLRRTPTYAAALLLLVAMIYSLWLKPNPKIVILNQENTIHHSTETYHNTISKIWRKSLLNQSKLTISSINLNKAITEQFPELSSVQIELPLLGQRANVVLTPGRPVLQLLSGRGGFYVDKNGKALAAVGVVQTSKLNPLPVVQDNANFELKPGDSLLTAADVGYIIQLQRYLRAQKLAVDSLSLSGNSARQLDVRLRNQKYYLKFSLSSDAREAVGSYLAAREILRQTNVTPSEYIDLRVSQKVFYK